MWHSRNIWIATMFHFQIVHFFSSWKHLISSDMFTLAWILPAKSLRFLPASRACTCKHLFCWFSVFSPSVVYCLLDLIFLGSYMYYCSRVMHQHLIHSLTEIFCHYFFLLFGEINVVDASSVWAGHKVTAKTVTVHDALGFSAFYMEAYIYLCIQKASILLK